MHHSPGLHSKQNVKLNQLKRIIHKKWLGAPLVLRKLTMPTPLPHPPTGSIDITNDGKWEIHRRLKILTSEG